MPKPRYNQNITVTIKNLGANGEGVGNWHGFTIFADRTLPGEEVRGRLIEKHRRYGRMHVDTVLSPSPHRIEPSCPYFDRCGGCSFMHLNYSDQLEAKRTRVIEDLKYFGKIDTEVSPCYPSPRQLGYRNKMQAPAAGENGTLQLGLYSRNSHELVDIDFCPVHCELGEKIYKSCRAILKDEMITPFNEETLEGELRYLLIKTAIHTKQVLVVLITAGKVTSKLQRAAKRIMADCSEVKGIVQNVNPNPGNVVLGNCYHLLEGESSIEEQILGIDFKISPASFFQVNPLQAEILYEKAIDLAELSGNEVVLDAYCGVGTLSLLMAHKAKKIIGIECVPEAIQDAFENAKKNSITNCEFICDNAELFIKKLDKVDVALLNPPRKGCEVSFLESLGILQPQKIVYISCAPATLARDLAHLKTYGYSIDLIQPFDMFPQTAHVECIVKLTYTKNA